MHDEKYWQIGMPLERQKIAFIGFVPWKEGIRRAAVKNEWAKKGTGEKKELVF